LHPLAPSQSNSITDWRVSSQGLAAVRDFYTAHVGCGVRPGHSAMSDQCPVCPASGSQHDNGRGRCRESAAPRRAVLVGDHAEAVVLDLVQPLFRWRAALTPFSAPIPYDVIDTAGLFEAAQVSRCWRRRARLDWHTTRRHCSAHTWALRLR